MRARYDNCATLEMQIIERKLVISQKFWFLMRFAERIDWKRIFDAQLESQNFELANSRGVMRNFISPPFFFLFFLNSRRCWTSDVTCLRRERSEEKEARVGNYALIVRNKWLRKRERNFYVRQIIKFFLCIISYDFTGIIILWQDN